MVIGVLGQSFPNVRALVVSANERDTVNVIRHLLCMVVYRVLV